MWLSLLTQASTKPCPLEPVGGGISAQVIWLRFTRPVIQGRRAFPQAVLSPFHWRESRKGSSFPSPSRGRETHRVVPWSGLSWCVWFSRMIGWLQSQLIANAGACETLGRSVVYSNILYQNHLLHTIIFQSTDPGGTDHVSKALFCLLYFISQTHFPLSVLLVIPQSWLESPPVRYSSGPLEYFTFKALGNAYQL